LLTNDPEAIAFVREFETKLNRTLRSCVRRGNAKAAALLLEFGVDPDLISPSPLFEFLRVSPSVEVLTVLLRAGVDWAATEWDEEGYEVQEAAWHCIDWSLVFRGPEHMGPGYRTIEQKLRLNLQRKNQGEPGFHDLNESRYNECISLLAAVREAGSWKGYVNAVVIAHGVACGALTTRPLSAPSLEFVDTAPGTRGAGARPLPLFLSCGHRYRKQRQGGEMQTWCRDAAFHI
jgi:hypothetical protein